MLSPGGLDDEEAVDVGRRDGIGGGGGSSAWRLAGDGVCDVDGVVYVAIWSRRKKTSVVVRLLGM